MQTRTIYRKKDKTIARITINKSNNNITTVLDYKKDNILKRTRHTYKKDNIIFELDEYTQPEKCKVVSLEGEKNIVDIIWHSL